MFSPTWIKIFETWWSCDNPGPEKEICDSIKNYTMLSAPRYWGSLICHWRSITTQPGVHPALGKRGATEGHSPSRWSALSQSRPLLREKAGTFCESFCWTENLNFLWKKYLIKKMGDILSQTLSLQHTSWKSQLYWLGPSVKKICFFFLNLERIIICSQ